MLFIIVMSCSRKRDDDKQVFRYNQPEGLVTLDPAFAKSQPVIWATHQIYNTLVEIDEDLHIKPSLAYRWEVSDDGLTYTFHLRDSVYFHDNPAFTAGKGRKLRAEDFRYSLGRIIDRSVSSPGAWLFNGRVDSLSPFRAPDDSTFQLKLLYPFPPILGILSMQYCSVVPEEVVSKYGKDFRRNACGTGPFQLHSWEEGQALILHRYNRYFEHDSTGPMPPDVADFIPRQWLRNLWNSAGGSTLSMISMQISKMKYLPKKAN